MEMSLSQSNNNNSGALKAGLLAMLLVLVPVMAFAQSSVWEWQMSLKVENTGDAMYMPSAAAFDAASERYYAVDTGRNRLVSFSREGELLKAFTANDQLQSPFDMVRMDNGRLWVVEKGRNSLTLIDVAAQKVQPHVLRDAGRLVFPDRIAKADGQLYLLDRAGGNILRLTEDLSVEQRYGCRDCSAGFADFVIHAGEILAIEARDKKIYRFSKAGEVLEVIDLSGEAGFPVSLDIGPAGFYYVLDRHANSVLVYDENGRFRYRFLSTGQSPGKIYFPSQVRFDPWGHLCVVDEGNGRIEVYGQ
jgi:DNA-binding beta-propeller fold protein YncE